MKKASLKVLLNWVTKGILIALDDGSGRKNLYKADYIASLLCSIRLASSSKTSKKFPWSNQPPLNNGMSGVEYGRFYILSEEYYNQLQARANAKPVKKKSKVSKTKGTKNGSNQL